MNNDMKVMNLIGVGLDSELAQKAVTVGFTLTKLRRASKSELDQHFDDKELVTIWEAVKRKPIPRDIVQRLIEECDWKCCICWDYSVDLPIIIHHIEEHSRIQDDSYDNLVVLCLNHHGLAHSNWEISRHPLPPELIRNKKREWIAELTEFKAGLRPAPGYEHTPGEPRLEFSTNIDYSPPTPAEVKAGWQRSWFIRLRIENSGESPARNCFGRLLKASDKAGKQLTRFDSLDLYWTRQDRPENYTRIDVRENGDFAYLDIAQIKEAENILSLRVLIPDEHRLVVTHESIQNPENLSPGTYYLCIAVYADNASIDPTWFKINWEADYSIDPPCSIESEAPPSTE